MKAFNLTLEKLVLRLYLMMLVIVIAGFAHIWWLALLALPVFMSCLLGIEINRRHMRHWSEAFFSKAIEGIKHLRTPLHHTE